MLSLSRDWDGCTALIKGIPTTFIIVTTFEGVDTV